MIVAKDLEARERLQQQARGGAGRAVSRTSSRACRRSSWARRSAGRCSTASSGPDKDEVRRHRARVRRACSAPTRARGTSTSTGWSRRARCASTSTRTRRAGSASARARSPPCSTPPSPARRSRRCATTSTSSTSSRAPPTTERASFETLSSLQVPTPSGRMVPLQQFATFVEEQEFPLVWRRDRVPTLTVRADVVARRAAGRRWSARSRRRSPSSTRSCRSPTGSRPAACTRRARRRARRCSPSCR